MNPWQLIVSHEAAQVLRRQERTQRVRLMEKIDLLSLDPYPGPGRDVKPLQAFPGMWRLRVGNWRILYTIDQYARTVNIVSVRSRGQAYRR